MFAHRHRLQAARDDPQAQRPRQAATALQRLHRMQQVECERLGLHCHVVTIRRRCCVKQDRSRAPSVTMASTSSHRTDPTTRSRPVRLPWRPRDQGRRPPCTIRTAVSGAISLPACFLSGRRADRQRYRIGRFLRAAAGRTPTQPARRSVPIASRIARSNDTTSLAPARRDANDEARRGGSPCRRSSANANGTNSRSAPASAKPSSDCSAPSRHGGRQRDGRRWRLGRRKRCDHRGATGPDVGQWPQARAILQPQRTQAVVDIPCHQMTRRASPQAAMSWRADGTAGNSARRSATNQPRILRHQLERRRRRRGATLPSRQCRPPRRPAASATPRRAAR